MRVTDRRGRETREDRHERIVRRALPGGIFFAVGLVLFGIEGCAALEVAAGRARVSSALFWVLLTGFAGYFALAGLELLLIGTMRLTRPLYNFIRLASPAARTAIDDRADPIPPPRPETPGERARWDAFWRGLRRRFRRRP